MARRSEARLGYDVESTELSEIPSCPKHKGKRKWPGFGGHSRVTTAVPFPRAACGRAQSSDGSMMLQKRQKSSDSPSSTFLPSGPWAQDRLLLHLAGGPFRLGAFDSDEFRGDSFLLGSLGYLRNSMTMKLVVGVSTRRLFRRRFGKPPTRHIQRYGGERLGLGDLVVYIGAKKDPVWFG